MEGTIRGSRAPEPEVAVWLSTALDDPGPFTTTPVGGGNSNETLLLESPAGRWILWHPPPASLSPGAHSMGREHRVLTAISGRGVPAPAPLAFADESIPGGPWLGMEMVDGVALTEELPAGYPPGARSVAAVGEAALDALAALHRVDWRAAGLEGFGRPDGFLERQVGRWRKHFERHQVRGLADFDRVATWLDANPPAPQEPALIHGDFHLDNCLFAPRPPARVAAIVDWEMATVGDPLLDLGLLLGFWGDERPARPAMPWVQALTRVPGAPSRAELADHYAPPPVARSRRSPGTWRSPSGSWRRSSRAPTPSTLPATSTPTTREASPSTSPPSSPRRRPSPVSSRSPPPEPLAPAAPLELSTAPVRPVAGRIPAEAKGWRRGLRTE